MMLNQNQYDFCKEFYTIEKSIEVVVNIAGHPEIIRIEALYSPITSRYSTKAYILEHFTLQPTYPQSQGKFLQPPTDKAFWIKWDLPWTDRTQQMTHWHKL